MNWDKARSSDIPRPASSVLRDLLAIAELVLDKPYIAYGHREAIDDIAGEVAAHVKRPNDGHEGSRFVDDTATWLVQSLRNVADSSGPVKGGPRDRWVEIARYLATCVREREIAALDADLAASATSEGAGGARRQNTREQT